MQIESIILGVSNLDRPIIDFETDRLHIRTVCEADRDAYMSLRVNNSDLSTAYSIIPGFEDYEWESELQGNGDIYLSVFLKPDETFIASASIQGYQTEIVELGYDVVEEYRNQGFATEIVEGLRSETRRIRPDAEIIIRINKDNEASKRVAEKCGGKFKRYEDSVVSRMLASEIKEKSNNKEMNEIRLKMAELVESGKDAVCVYELP